MNHADAGLERVITDLDRLGQTCRAAQIPAQYDRRITQALGERAARVRNQRPTRGLHMPLRGHRPIAVIAAAVLSILVVMGAASAAVPVLTRVFSLGGAGTVIQQNLGTQLNLSKTLAGYTMTIKRVYADPNQVLIAYSITPPATRLRRWNFSTGNLTLVDSQGTDLPERSLVADGGGGEPQTTLQGFDAAAITGNPREIHLHLTVPWIEAMEQLHAPSGAGQSSGQEFPGAPTSGTHGSTVTTHAVGERNPWMQIVRTYGPISFDVTVPFERGRTVDLHQQVLAGGVKATLQRVVFSSTETRAYVNGLQPNTAAALSTVGWDSGAAGSTEGRSGTVTVFSFLASPVDKHGEWTLAVKPMPPLRLPPGVTPPPGSAPAKGGPWTFHFHVP